MGRSLIFVIVLAICAGGYYFYFTGGRGQDALEAYEEAKEDMASLRSEDTVWTPEMNE